MKEMALSEIAAVIGGSVVRGTKNLVIKDVVSRAKYLEDNNLLFNLPRKTKTDWESLKSLSSCAIVTNLSTYRQFPDNFTIIEVPNVREAYWAFVEHYRSMFTLPVIAVTGTCGKTTTKEMIKHILQKYKVQSTNKSYNALALNLEYLLGIEERTKVAVFETGVATKGDLLYSCRHFRPTIGIITNIGIDHLEGCGNLDTYISEKAKMAAGLGNKGTLILNSDDERIRKLAFPDFQGSIIRFGFGDNATIRGKDFVQLSDRIRFTIFTGLASFMAEIQGYGKHTAYNALAAAAACYALGIPLKDIVNRLSSFCHLSERLQLTEAIGGSLMINDTWSSNPTSTIAAIKVLAERGNGKRTIAVLGEMTRLGQFSAEMHAKIGQSVYEQGIHVLVTIGTAAAEAAIAAVKAGMPVERVRAVQDSEEALTVLQPLLAPDVICLVKVEYEYRELVEHLMNSK